MNRIIIIVGDGFVQEIYADNPDVDVEIIDMDTQDAEQAEQAEREVDEIRLEAFRGELFGI